MSQLSKSRDMKVLELLEKHRYCTTWQVAQALFANIKSPKQRLEKAGYRLKVLHDHKLINRMRIPGQHYIYTVKEPKYTHLVNHYLTIMDIWLALKAMTPSGSVLRHEVEIKFDGLVCDLWVEHSNNFRGMRQEYFIEVELASSGDVVDKIKRYEGLAWMRKASGQDMGAVTVVYDNQRTAMKLMGGNTFNVDLRVIYLQDFAKQWKW